jgi:hypothetical protein
MSPRRNVYAYVYLLQTQDRERCFLARLSSPATELMTLPSLGPEHGKSPIDGELILARIACVTFGDLLVE